MLIGLFQEIAQETAKAIVDIRQKAQQFKVSNIIVCQEQIAKLIEQRKVIMKVVQLVEAKDARYNI